MTNEPEALDAAIRAWFAGSAVDSSPAGFRARMSDALRAYLAAVPSPLAEALEVSGSQAAMDVLAERTRQIEAEGWTPKHDDKHDKGEMTAAAFGYLQSAMSKIGLPRFTIHDAPNFWPWDRKWFKPSTPRRDLVKAGALILAEIDRLDRLPAAPTISDRSGGAVQNATQRQRFGAAGSTEDDSSEQSANVQREA